MHSFLRAYPTESKLLVVLVILCTGLSLASPDFLTLVNFTSLLNNNAVNVIWAVGLLVVLIAGGIDISFAVAASVVQYLCVYAFAAIGGGNWVIGFLFAGSFGLVLGLINAFLIHQFRIISIVVTISTFNAFFGLLMFFSSGRFLYNLPSWWSRRVILWEYQTAGGTWAELILPVAVMAAAMFVHLVPDPPHHHGPPALRLRRQPRRRAEGGNSHRPHAGHRPSAGAA